MNASSTYNGWSNKETWNVDLWLSNDADNYNDVNALIREYVGASVYEVAEALQSFTEELAERACPGVIEGASFVSDMFGDVLNSVNFQEIVENWVEDMDGITVDDHELQGTDA